MGGDAPDHRRGATSGRDGREFDVVDCQYATFFHELDEPDLGFLLVCSADFDMLSDVPQITLERTQTRMQGATHCDFRYRLADEAGPSPD